MFVPGGDRDRGHGPEVFNYVAERKVEKGMAVEQLTCCHAGTDVRKVIFF